MKLDSEQIQRLIPHRAPFLFVESAEILGPHDISGVCVWDAQSPIFDGHFPEFSVVPGVLIVEAAAQLAGALISHNGQQRELPAAGIPMAHPLGVLIGIKRASFHKPVLPNDRITFKVTIENPVAGMVSVRAEAVGSANQKICKCDLSVAVVDKSNLIASGKISSDAAALTA